MQQQQHQLPPAAAVAVSVTTNAAGASSVSGTTDAAAAAAAAAITTTAAATTIYVCITFSPFTDAAAAYSPVSCGHAAATFDPSSAHQEDSSCCGPQFAYSRSA
jgi:hypothetical protein